MLVKAEVALGKGSSGEQQFPRPACTVLLKVKVPNCLGAHSKHRCILTDNNWSENHPFTSLIVCIYVYVERDEYTELASTYTAPRLSIMSYMMCIPGSAVGLRNFQEVTLFLCASSMENHFFDVTRVWEKCHLSVLW